MLSARGMRVLALALSAAAAPLTIPIGSVMPLTRGGAPLSGGRRLNRAIELAVAEINADAVLLPDVTLELRVRDNALSGPVGASAAFELFTAPDRVAGIIGTSASNVAKAVSAVAGIFSTPVVDPSSTASELSSDTNFPFFTRVSPPDSKQAVVLANALVRVLGWRNLAVLHTDNDFAAGFARDLEAELARKYALALSGRYVFPVGGDPTEQLRAIARSSTRVIVLLGYGADAARAFRAAAALGMTGASEYAWVGHEGWADSTLWTNVPEDEQPAIRAAAAGAIATTPSQAYRTHAVYESWKARWDADAIVQANGWNGTGVGTYASFAADATWTLAHALHAVCYTNRTECATSTRDGQRVLRALLDVDFVRARGAHRAAKWRVARACARARAHSPPLPPPTSCCGQDGLTGRVMLDAQGDRTGGFDLRNLDAEGSWKTVGQSDANDGFHLGPDDARSLAAMPHAPTRRRG